ncbi:MAG: baseplate J/gp47 family protein [Chloroflexi bacterium]|nr:baseplate J/gp47 family protein [Chloroflexota bacterium]
MALLKKKLRPPPRSQELIFLDSDDDLGTVRSKLEASPADEIFLVVPRKATTLRTPLEYRILARMAHELSGEVVIVSPDGGRRQLARQEGLRTRRGYRGVRRLAEAAGAPRTWLPGMLDVLPLPSLATVFVTCAMVALLAGVGLFTLPEMRVSVTPETKAVKQGVDLTVDPSVRGADVSRAILPGEQFTGVIDVLASIPTTGQRNVGADRARGEVVFSNRSGTLVTIPKGAVVIAKTGVRFLTDQETKVTPYSSSQARVGITAESAGSPGNLDANQVQAVEGGFDGISLTNPRPTAGGGDKPARAVAQEDIDKLKEELSRRGTEKAVSELTQKAGGAKSIPSQTVKLRVENQNIDQAVGAQADAVTGRATFTATALGWDNQGLNELVQKVIVARNGGDLYSLPLSQLRMPPPAVIGVQDNQIKVRLDADALLVRTIESDLIQSAVRGKSADEARDVLRTLPGLAGPARVEVVPNWAPRAYRVRVDVAAPK